MKAHIVLGMGYGDEGKGLVTDYLTSISKKPLVIRFNGGHQARHTVFLENRTSHVFSHVGSGSLRNASTYWTRYCTVSPTILVAEISKLSANFKVYIHTDSPVVTHYDVLYNRLLELSRGKNRHGSCGEGIGATFERNEKIKLTVGKLSHEKILDKSLLEIRNYYKKKIETELMVDFNRFNHSKEDQTFRNSVSILHKLLGLTIEIVDNGFHSTLETHYDTLIFEGAQGILLDQNHGLFPHVTRSNTTCENAISLINSFPFKLAKDDVEINYVTRAYQTRHGNGPFCEDQIKLNNTQYETNIENDNQGKFRKGYLDINLLRYSAKTDYLFSNRYPKNLFITCMDQITEFIVRENGHLYSISSNQLPSLLDMKIDKLFVSFGPSAKHVSQMQHILL